MNVPRSALSNKLGLADQALEDEFAEMKYEDVPDFP